MKKHVIFMAVFILLTSLIVSQASMIGKWDKGIVTKPPWYDKYLKIEIDNVRYVIMYEIKVVKRYGQNGIENVELSSVKEIENGHTVLFKKEGNRIYQIEILD